MLPYTLNIHQQKIIAIFLTCFMYYILQYSSFSRIFYVDKEFIELLKSEEKMYIYLQQHEKEVHKIDSRIWQVHVSVPKKKQMPVINNFIQKILAKQKIACSFLPMPMIRAKVYKNLKIPYTWNIVTNQVKIDAMHMK